MTIHAKIRLEVDVVFNCRPKKGERRAKDGTGRLLKCQISHGDDLTGLLLDAALNRAASEEMAPGYSEVVAIRAYDNAEFHRDPLKAVPFHAATKLEG